MSWFIYSYCTLCIRAPPLIFDVGSVTICGPWTNWFDELGSIGCEESGAISAAVKKNNRWSIIRGGKLVTDWFADLRAWTISQDGTYLAAAVADKRVNQELSWKVIVLPLTP
jgi:hypothetical protein